MPISTVLPITMMTRMMSGASLPSSKKLSTLKIGTLLLLLLMRHHLAMIRMMITIIENQPPQCVKRSQRLRISARDIALSSNDNSSRHRKCTSPSQRRIDRMRQIIERAIKIALSVLVCLRPVVLGATSKNPTTTGSSAGEV